MLILIPHFFQSSNQKGRAENYFLKYYRVCHFTCASSREDPDLHIRYMPETEFNNLIHRYLTGDCTPVQKARIEKWISSSPENRMAFEAIKKIWEVEPEKELHADLKKAWQLLERDMDKLEDVRNKQHAGKRTRYNNGRKNKYIWFRAAAFLLVGILISLFTIWFAGGGLFMSQQDVAIQEIRTERAQQTRVIFGDGSEVTLNASSIIRFPRQFGSDAREVFLEGEAWFDVAHHPDLEFIVNTPDAIVHVLGTEFNIRAYSGDPAVEVVVGDGVVSVHAAGGAGTDASAGVRLEKNEMSRVIRGSAPAAAVKVDVANYASWLTGDFIFNETPFARVLAEWERQFDVDFSIENEELKNTPLTGEFRDESFEEMLRLTSMALDFGYKHEDGTITIIK